MVLEKRDVWEELEGVEVGETMVGIYCMREEFIFNKKEFTYTYIHIQNSKFSLE